MSQIPPLLAAYLAGLFTTASLVAGLFFLRFWRRTRDTLRFLRRALTGEAS